MLIIYIAILIALSINTWNENRKDLRQEIELLKDIRDDLVVNKSLVAEGMQNHFTDLAYQKATTRYTGPNVDLLSEPYLDSVSQINYTIVEMVFGSINPTFNPNRIELLSDESLRSRIAEFMIMLAKYKEVELEAKEMALELRRIHQEYIWLMEDFNVEVNSPHSDYLGWLRDRTHHNIAVDRVGIIQLCISRLKQMDSKSDEVLLLIDAALERLTG